MRAWFRALLRAVESVAASLGEAVPALHELSTSAAPDEGLGVRVAELEAILRDVELRMDRHYAEAEALLLKAKGKYDAARASEERARRLSESAPSAQEVMDGLFEEWDQAQGEAGGVHPADAAGGGGEGLHAVPSALDARRGSKAGALAMKLRRLA